jgi:hypothetical protein
MWGFQVRTTALALTAMTLIGIVIAPRDAVGGSPSAEPLGPSSQHTSLVISEIMYAPAPRSDGRDLEFIEIYNSQPWFQDLGGYRLTGSIDFSFSPGTQLAANSFLVVAKAPADLQAVYGITNVLGPYAQDLPGDSGTIRLLHRNGGVLLEMKYASQPPWPGPATQVGHSLVLARPSLGQGNPKAWAASARIGGSPGTFEPVAADPLQGVVINEFLAKGNPGTLDFIELYNHSVTVVDVSGCILTDDPWRNRCVLPASTTITPGGFLVFDENQLGFGLSRQGETLYLFNSNRTAVLDAVRFGPQAEGISSGRFPNGSDLIRPLAQPTPGKPNQGLLVSDVVINEIMYDPISGQEDDEYVELFNHSSRAVDVGGWRFVDGIDFVVPTNTLMAPQGYLVVAKNTARLLTNYPNLSVNSTVGNFHGTLAKGGERLALARVDGVVVDEVTYDSGGQWGRWAHRGGSSLELVDPRSDHALAANWADSDESAKAPWTTVEVTGRLVTYEYIFTYPVNILEVISFGAGEYLLDNVEVSKAGQQNLVSNPSFQTGLAGWTGQGSLQRIGLDSAGYDDTACLRLQASDRGDPGPNRLMANLRQTLQVGDLVTLRARVRWLHGCPEILLHLYDGYLEAYGRLEVPANLGTPGGPNSRSVANAGPAIADVTHHPVLPAGGEPISVSARAHDPDGLAAVTLWYRLDPQTNWVAVAMRDEATEGDEVAGDGIYSGLIPGAAAGTMIAFWVAAEDGAQPPATARFPTDAPGRQCLVRVGESPSTNQFGTLRLWMTQQTLSTWRSRQTASSDPLDVTVVHNDSRVIYNVGATFAGSKFASLQLDSPTGRPCDYDLTFPADDPLLGDTEVRLSVAGVVVPIPPQDTTLDTTLQSEQAAFWLAEQMGLPFLHRRYTAVFVNGVRRGQLMEDAQKPNRDYVEEWFASAPEGELYKLQFHVEMDTTGRNGDGGGIATLNRYASSNAIPETAYRWIWNKRSAEGSNNDYRSVLELVNAFNRTDNQQFTTEVTAQIEVDQWMRTLAVERLVGNWDSFCYANEQNMYFYRPPQDRWQLCIWDMDMPMGTAATASSGDSIFSNTETHFGRTVCAPEQRFIRHPPFCRAYLRALQEVIAGAASEIGPLLDAKAAAFAANGITATSPQGIKSYLAARTNSINQQLARFRVPFTLIGSATQPSQTSQAGLTGTAPFEVETIQVNGARLPVVWTTATNWSVAVPLTALTNQLVIIGQGTTGETLPGASATVTVIYTGTEPLPHPPLFINEWMAANTHTVADPADGDYADWFELYNPNEVAVDLFGYRLTDDLTNTVKFVVPAGWSIPPGGHLLIWADEESYRNLTGTNLHVNFKLSRDGEGIALYHPDGSLADVVEFGPQTNDVSQGRWPDGGAGPFVFFAWPTPGSPNVNDGLVQPLRIGSLMGQQGHELILTWTDTPGNRYTLQSAISLSDPNWQVVPNSEGADTLRLAPTNGSAFFRLVKP